ncbi:Crp/Fnr family transcriptional regulator [Rubrimonas cliftonensis]|uniref:Transcriptional regulator, Crp/Fnr family n=1 Tax=Rubrimonas cliftonensis TaxID=89524 RepID=A0A1H4G244_9RHOB|nr:Crp/Fnr family transcriptional regulator [Rubrimonas cliftonensis]SEB03008.1 transcriptional regulator, Crp/Fnr family [Rubrimonas cliftonensis]
MTAGDDTAALGAAGVVFSSLKGEAGAALLARGARKRFPAGASIYHRGDAGGSMLIIERGVAEISVTSMAGRKSVLAHAAAGEILGEIALLDGGARSADVMALTEVEGVSLTRSVVMTFLTEHPEAMAAMIAQLAARARNASEMFETAAMTDAGARLAVALLRLAGRWGDDRPAPGGRPLTQGELGEYAGLSRENVNRRLRAWSRLGVVSLTDGHVSILDPESLRDIAECGDAGS